MRFVIFIPRLLRLYGRVTNCSYIIIRHHTHTHVDMAGLEDPLDVQCVADAARDQLSNILTEVDGPKDVVIQADLMSLLNHVTPFSFLKE